MNTIELNEISAADCQEQLAGTIFNELRNLYGDLTPQLTEHLVNEVLYQISFRLRQGEPLALEALGLLIPARVGDRRIVSFTPDPVLLTDMHGKPANIITLADRRQAREVA